MEQLAADPMGDIQLISFFFVEPQLHHLSTSPSPYLLAVPGEDPPGKATTATYLALAVDKKDSENSVETSTDKLVPRVLTLYLPFIKGYEARKEGSIWVNE